jgi:hypothetical protein
MVLEHSWPILAARAEGCAVVYAGPESFACAWYHSSSSDQAFETLGEVLSGGGPESAEEGVQRQRGEHQPLQLCQATVGGDHPGAGGDVKSAEDFDNRLFLFG